MSNDTVESSAQAAETESLKPRRKAAKTGKAKKKTASAKKTAKPQGERTNKKAEDIGLMKRIKGATLAGIMKATGWQSHTVRGWLHSA